jgi:hypothetical protein
VLSDDFIFPSFFHLTIFTNESCPKKDRDSTPLRRRHQPKEEALEYPERGKEENARAWIG